ncbi:MAG: bifunctional phosphopantothenoylcysteine decarboxylase/phosphopantothenate--cysteine ligase CoaBC [Clostridia bacterium]|nr:bifunctional phosphopantothenoylcysteine decarboxylase/phosphopantothenate--cysteine ligase CoaBC [Clostridia bacterium]
MAGSRIVLGITGGIAAYKAAGLCSSLIKAGCEVRVVMTKNACEFITPLTLETLSKNAVSVEEFSHAYEIGHISLAKWADAFVVAPATANIIAKMAGGIADDLLSTTFLAMTCPVLAAPAMNANMWRNPAVQDNIAKLRARGVRFIGPESGRLACGDADIGRMSEPEDIARECLRMLSVKKDLTGYTFVVTAGPTHEPIDPVRYISNRSSGRMGIAIAQACASRGARTVLVAGPVSVSMPDGCEIIRIDTTQQLHDTLIGLSKEADCIIQAAAPADFRAEQTAASKIKRTGDVLDLKLVPNPDIAAKLGSMKRSGQVLVAFAAETDHAVENARSKLVKKNADFVVLNDVTKPGAGFDVDTNIITIVGRETEEVFPLMSKREAADIIVDRCARMLGGK